LFERIAMKIKLNLEQLESRLTPTTVCNANPIYESECLYLDNLIPLSVITDQAVKSGNWSDPATWSQGVPGNGANVWVPNGYTVVVDGIRELTIYTGQRIVAIFPQRQHVLGG